MMRQSGRLTRTVARGACRACAARQGSDGIDGVARYAGSGASRRATWTFGTMNAVGR
jgi:hypothetical protein